MTYSLPSEHESRISIQGVEIALGFPDEFKFEWIGQRDVMDQLLAAWLVIDKDDIPLNPRLIGKPGVGKTTLAYAAGKKLGRDIYIYQCTMDTRPEDLLITPVIDKSGGIRYVASSLVTAMNRSMSATFSSPIRSSSVESPCSTSTLPGNCVARYSQRGPLASISLTW